MILPTPRDPERSAAAKPPSVCCVLVNWNGWKDTIACLEALTQQDYPTLRVIVVDNGSTDDSVQRIAAAFPTIELIAVGSNRGFSGGCNIGLRSALAMGADWVWLLNTDTIPPADTVTKLVASANHAHVGIVGTVLYFMHEPTQIQAWGGGKVVRWLGFVRHYTAQARLGSDSYLTFASVLVRRELLLEIGTLDEGYFMYFEDSDFCFRTRNAGWGLVVAADTAVLHKEGGSRKTQSNPTMERVVTVSGLRFLRRHGALPPLAMVLFVFSRMAKRLLRGDWTGLLAVARGAVDGWRDGSLEVQGTL